MQTSSVLVPSTSLLPIIFLARSLSGPCSRSILCCGLRAGRKLDLESRDVGTAEPTPSRAVQQQEMVSDQSPHDENSSQHAPVVAVREALLPPSSQEKSYGDEEDG